jgi:amidase
VRSHLLSRDQGIDAALAEHDLDALVAPTGSPSWPIDLVNGDHFLGASSFPCAMAGYPVINMPAGHAFGLPVGISFMGTAYSEPMLIKLASGFEHVTHVRRAPTFIPTMALPTGDDSLTKASVNFRAARLRRMAERIKSGKLSGLRARFI